MTEKDAKEITPYAVAIFAAMVGAWTRPGAADEEGMPYLATLRALAIKQAVELVWDVAGYDAT